MSDPSPQAESGELDGLNPVGLFEIGLSEAVKSGPSLLEEDERKILESLLRQRGAGLASLPVSDTIGRGGTGTVFLARDRILRRAVAIKKLNADQEHDAEARVRFLEEAQITGQLEHPNIVPVHELGEDPDGRLYIAMRLVEGESLDRFVSRIHGTGFRKPPLTELLGIFLKICDAVAFAHSKGVIHRDLKPANVMLGDFGQVAVMDWGLAKLLDHPDSPARPHPGENGETVTSSRAEADALHTRADQVQGTPAFMAPEQARADSDVDQRSDIYALGAILYEMLCGELPVDGCDDVLDLIRRTGSGEIAPIREREAAKTLPAELCAIVMKALAHDPTDRYQDGSELSGDIQLFMEGRAVSAKRDSILDAVIKFLRRNRAASLTAAAGLLALFAIGMVSIERIRTERDNAVAAQQAQRRTALSASRRLAFQAVRSAERGRFQEASRRADDAMAVAPDGPWGYFARGSVARSQKDFATAAADFERGLNQPDGEQRELRTAFVEARAMLGQLESTELTLAADTDDWRILAKAGNTLYAAGKWDECQDVLRRAIRLMQAEPDLPDNHEADLVHVMERAAARKACEGFHDEIRDLSQARKVERVRAKIGEINGCDMMIRLVDAKPRQIFFPNVKRLRHLDPLRGLELAPELDLFRSQVRDLSPIRGTHLNVLYLNESPVEDIGPLRGMPLTRLEIKWTQVRDLEPLRGAPLRELHCSNSPITDLSALEGMPLEFLDITGTGVSDLTPLQGLPLETLYAMPHGITDLEPLAGSATLRNLVLGIGVENLSPLKGINLEMLVVQHLRVSDLSPLAGMPLRRLNVKATHVNDLSYLRGVPIESINISDTAIRDLSPLLDSPLQRIELEGCLIEDLSILNRFDQLDHELHPWLDYLNGHMDEDQLLERLTSIHRNGALRAGKREIQKIEADALPDFVEVFRGMRAYGEGRPEEALKIYRELIKTPDGRYLLGRAYERLERELN